MPDVDLTPRQRFIVCGDNPMAYRLIDELISRYDAEVTVILASRQQNWAPKIVQMPGLRVIESDRLGAEAFDRAGVTQAAALALLEQDDAGNVDAALIAQEANPNLRVVMRMFNERLGERITQLLDNCVVISAAAIAAPAFVAAALDESSTPPITIAGRTVIATTRANAGQVITGLARTAGVGEPEILGDPVTSDLVLAPSEPTRPRSIRRHQWSLPLAVLFGARLRLILAIFAGVLVVGTLALVWAGTGTWIQAAYVAFLTEIGGADIDPGASGVEKVTLVVLSVVSIALIPALTAAVVDAAVRARLRREAGGLTEPMSDHVVVVGLGHVGTRVIRSLHDSGIDVVAIERDRSVPGIAIARELGMPVLIGDASLGDVLASACVSAARALIIVSTDDVTNLEIALLGRAAKHDLRLVLRLFDGEFADRVQRAFDITTSRSVSYLAAPAFAAAMLGRQVIATIPVGRRVLLVAEVPVHPGSLLANALAGAVSRPGAARLLAIEPATDAAAAAQWSPPDTRPLAPGERLIVLATRAGLSGLLADTQAPFGPTDRPTRPVAPHPRAG